jgi:signal peptidase I
MDRYSNKVVSTHLLFPIIEEAMACGQKAIFTVSGDSMRPLIVNNRDQVLLSSSKGKLLEKGDIILFRKQSGRYILHRIYKKEANYYHTIGDACLCEDGIVKPSEIIGVVEEIYRKGKKIDCNSFLWRTIFTTWRYLLPIRQPLLNTYYWFTRRKRF